MANRELEILEIIKQNPTIGQNEIAKLLNIQRSTVAVHIASLSKRGLLKRGYILNNQNYVLGIGAANVDIYGKSSIPIKQNYDHPAKITSNVGGVTRNIITNISLLGEKTKLISAIGDDAYGDIILSQTKDKGVDVNDCLKVQNSSSSLFMQVLNENNDMHLALCDMSVLDKMDTSFIKSKRSIIENAQAIIFDPSLDTETIKELINISRNKVNLYADPISDEYAKKLKPFIKDLYCIKPNKTELESLVDKRLDTNDDIEKACGELIRQGLNKIYVSLGEKGVYYQDQTTSIFKKLNPVKKMVNASGAGDAMFASIIYSELNEFELDKTLDYALASGIAAINYKETINPNLSIELLENILKENKNEH